MYQPGKTWLYRVHPGIKIVALVVLSTFLLVERNLLVLITMAILVWVCWITNHLSLRQLAIQFRYMAFVLIFYALVESIVSGWQSAAEVLVRMIVLVLAACLITLTTLSSRLISLFEVWLNPFRIIGAKPERVAFAFSMTLRFIPMLAERARDVRAASWARGVERYPLATVIPLLIEGLRMADAVVEALEARGVDDF